MVNSILHSTKKILGLDFTYTPFDTDIITHINAAFSVLNQLGIGPDDGFYIDDAEDGWDEFLVPANQLHLVKTYIFLKVRMLFDPPTTSFLITAMENQIKEYEWRLSTMRETSLQVLLASTPEEVL